MKTSQQIKPSPGQARKDALARRQRADILAAASSAFAEYGFSGAQMGKIAAAAEVSLTTLYSMFESKEVLYSVIVVEAAAAVRDSAIHTVEDIKDSNERLLAFIEALLKCYQENRNFMRLYVHATQGFPYRIRTELGEEALSIFQDVSGWMVATVTEVKREGRLVEGLDPEAVASVIMGGIVTICSQWAERGDQRPLNAAAPALQAIYKRLITS